MHTQTRLDWTAAAHCVDLQGLPGAWLAGLRGADAGGGVAAVLPACYAPAFCSHHCCARGSGYCRVGEGCSCTGLLWPQPGLLLHTRCLGSARRCCRNDHAGAVGAGSQLPPLHCVRYLPCMPVVCMCAVCCAQISPLVPSVQQHCCDVFRSGVWGCPVSCTKLHTRQPQDTHTPNPIDMGGCWGGLVGHTLTHHAGAGGGGGGCDTAGPITCAARRSGVHGWCGMVSGSGIPVGCGSLWTATE